MTEIKRIGKSHKEKIKEIRETMIKKQAGALVVNMLDEVAWLLNVRLHSHRLDFL
jgi:Xaa-Pro aminopeptidase